MNEVNATVGTAEITEGFDIERGGGLKGIEAPHG